MKLSWLTEHVCPGQWFKEESPLSATFNYFCILEEKKEKVPCAFWVPAFQEGLSEGPVSCVWSWLLLTSDQQWWHPGWHVYSHPLMGAHQGLLMSQPLSWGSNCQTAIAGISLIFYPCLLLLSRLTLLSLMVTVSSWSTLGFLVFRLTGTVPLLVGF